jgi:protein SCO1
MRRPHGTDDAVLPRRRTLLALMCVASLACAPDPQASFDAWRPGDPVPDVALVDQDGAPFRLSRYDDGPVVLGFVFTRCAVPTACPATMAKLRAIDEAGMPVLAVTLDPAHDDPAALQAYAARHGARFTLATGAAGIVDDALPSLFNVIALPRAGTIDHGVKIALLGPGRRPVAEWSDADVSVDEVRARGASWSR